MSKHLFRIVNLLAVTAIIFITLAGIFTYERYMATDDAHTINIAGQQRMLTVEIVEEIIFDHVTRQTTNSHNHGTDSEIAELVNRIYDNMNLLRSEITNDETIKEFNNAKKQFDQFVPFFTMKDYTDLELLHDAGEQTLYQFDLLVSAIKTEKSKNHTSNILFGIGFWTLSIIMLGILSLLIYKSLSKTISQSGFRYDRLFNNAPDAIFILDPDTAMITDVNKKASSYLGYEKEEMVGKTIFDLLYSDDEDTLAFAWARFIQSTKLGKPFTFETVHYHKDGHSIDVEVSGSLIERDGVAYRQNFVRDITERKKAEQELLAHYQDLAEAQCTVEEQNQMLTTLAEEANEAKNVALTANRTKSEFLANMSHELRTPLNAIIGFSEVMMNGTNGQLSDKHKEYANDIFESGHHLLKLINDILNLSKIEAGKTEIRPENVSICSVFRDCIGLIAERAQGKLINVEVKTSCDGLYVYADPIRLKQIILNLLSNSVKFTDMNGNIDIRCVVGDNVVISIEDNGIGMDDEGVDAALSKFGQVNTGLDRVYEGTGLGLPLSVELAELMNGSVDVVSELGTGTTITVTLPKAK